MVSHGKWQYIWCGVTREMFMSNIITTPVASCHGVSGNHDNWPESLSQPCPGKKITLTLIYWPQ
jgi:hypothetical protein